MNHRWVNTKDAAATVGCAQRTIEQWAREGKIRVRRIGERGQYQVAVDDSGFPLAPSGEGAD